jgi:hypothetical protein
MADYAGAVAAMRARFVAAWEPAAPWVYFEVIQTDSTERGVGLPGSKLWLTVGNIFVHLFVPLGYGLPEQLRLAGVAGEIFRAATFYVDNSVGAKVVSMAPSIPGGASNADNGNWFGVTVSIPFEFYFIA